MKTKLPLCCQIHPTHKCRLCKKMLCNSHLYCSDKCQEKYFERVRKRNSYKWFKEKAEWLKTNPTPREILFQIHSILDDYRAFKSQQKSDWAHESIDLLLSDLASNGNSKLFVPSGGSNGR